MIENLQGHRTSMGTQGKPAHTDSERWRIRHRDGWTGTAEILDECDTHTSSHSCGLKVVWFITQDNRKPDGTHVEDPRVCSLSELTFLEPL